MTVRSRSVALLRHLGLESVARLVFALPRKGARMSLRLAASGSAIGRKWADAGRRFPGQRQSFRAYRGLVARSIPLELILGTVDDGAIAVVVCLWNRPERISNVLRILDDQQLSRPVRLVFWNNQPDDSLRYRSAISAYSASGSLSSVEYYDSPHNIGGIGRFIAARELVSRGYSGAFLMMDDDQNFGPSFVSDLLAVSAPRSVAGVWGWTNDGAYWNRLQLESTGARADHVGTGGSVCDSSIVTDPGFFGAIPRPYLFMEDMWMSHYATHNGWSLSMVQSPFTFVLAELDQGHALFDRKELFFSWLAEPGHVPTRPASLG